MTLSASDRALTAVRTQEEVDHAREQMLADMDDAFLRCRELMHAWDEVGSYVSRRFGGRAQEITEEFRCDRCGTVRKDRLHAGSYVLIGRTYDHPEGYLMPGAGFTMREHVRKEKFARRAPADIPLGETA